MSLKERLNKEIKKEEARFHIKDEAFEYNSLGVLDLLLTDNEINSIFVSGAKNVFITKADKIYKSSATFRDNVQLENLIKKTANDIGIKIDKDNSYFKFNQKKGINVAMTLPPLSNNGLIYVKCYKDMFASFSYLIDDQCISKEMSFIFETLSYMGGNIIIAGKKNTLKTTFLNAMAKKVPLMEKAVFIDYSNEVNIDASNFTCFDFSNLDKNQNTKKELLDSIITFQPSKIFVNDPNDDFYLYYNYLQSGYKGMVITLEANSKKEVIEKLTYTILKSNPHLSQEQVKDSLINIFDLIIFTAKDEEGKRKVSALSQINSNGNLENIFYINDFREHASTGIKPKFFEEIKDMTSSNVFEVGYKHTYNKKFDTPENISSSKKSIDVLKKFKKRTEDVEINEEEQKVYNEFLSDEQEENEALTPQEDTLFANNETLENENSQE